LTVAARSPHSLARLPRGVATCAPEDVEPRAFDVVVECTGNRDGFGVARGAVRPRGTLVLKSTHGLDTPFDMTMAVVDEITVIGSRCGPFAPAIQLLASGQVDPGNLIDDVFGLSQALAAIERSREAGVFKVLMECGK
jgi:threonine dehydrogenase-like Zn-dependent dehydrogenase